MKSSFFDRGVDVPASIPLHSDPENRLLPQPMEGNFQLEWKEASQYNTKPSDSYTDYTMVQPALVVADSTGAVLQFWSWLRMGLESAPTALSVVPNPDPEHELKEVRLVTIRPVTGDIGPAVAEARPVRLHAFLPAGWSSSRVWNTTLGDPGLSPRDAV